MNAMKLKQSLVSTGRVMGAFCIALFMGGIFLLVLDCNPLEAYGIIFSKGYTGFDQVLRRMTPLMLTGLAVSIPMKTGMLNMGGEGQIQVGGLVAAMVGIHGTMFPGAIHPLMCILAAAVAGAIAALIPTLMKIKFGAGEVVTTIMLNYVIGYGIEYLTMYPLRGSDNMPQTAKIAESAKLARPMDGQQWSWGLVIAVVICIAVYFYLERTRQGLELKSAGLSPLTAKFQGVNIKGLCIAGMVMGGAIAGIGGSLEVLGGKYSYLDGYFDNYGFDGVAICYMAQGNPIGIIVTSFIVAVLKIGASALDRKTSISVFFSIALQGLIIILLVSPHLIELLHQRWRKLSAKWKKEGK